MHEKANIFQEIVAFFAKWGTIVMSIGVGVLAKVSTELLLKRKLSMLQWLGIMGVSIFGGYLMGMWCHINGWQEQSYYLVPITTLFSEKITIYMMTNYKMILSRILDIFINKAERNNDAQN